MVLILPGTALIGILGQKEGSVVIIFEDVAAQYLKEHPEVKPGWKNAGLLIQHYQKLAGAIRFVYKNSP